MITANFCPRLTEIDTAGWLISHLAAIMGCSPPAETCRPGQARRPLSTRSEQHGRRTPRRHELGPTSRARIQHRHGDVPTPWRDGVTDSGKADPQMTTSEFDECLLCADSRTRLMNDHSPLSGISITPGKLTVNCRGATSAKCPLRPVASLILERQLWRD